MTTALEKVARAIAQQIQELPYDKLPKNRKAVSPRAEWDKSDMDDIARAAIQALMTHRPPTICMVSESYDYNIGPQDAQQIWGGWLRAILNEEKETANAD